ncbi:hypothetical protein SS50377_22835 [Spironucleus salmonicida]|uniref:Uncharacterized protein n=1 Tax=Spironucleus salmonicida TaxID=348837 RepID=A0A9P8LVL9_9EUKA|nr:hypothetical protein SS50377_22835 [Spironucleus salmonicida]
MESSIHRFMPKQNQTKSLAQLEKLYINNKLDKMSQRLNFITNSQDFQAKTGKKETPRSLLANQLEDMDIQLINSYISNESVEDCPEKSRKTAQKKLSRTNPQSLQNSPFRQHSPIKTKQLVQFSSLRSQNQNQPQDSKLKTLTQYKKK